jgi:hypothetical protein
LGFDVLTARDVPTGGVVVILPSSPLLVAPGFPFTGAATAIGTYVREDINWNAKGIACLCAVTAGPGTVTFGIQTSDVGATYVDTVLQSVALGPAVSWAHLKVYPGLPVTANLRANDLLANYYRLFATVAGGAATWEMHPTLLG